MRYFFDLDDQVDEMGTDLPDRKAVPREALTLILAVAANAPARTRSIHLAVRDEQRRKIYAASLQLEGHWTDKSGA